MNLTELYSQIPADEHKNILISGDRVYVTNAEGTEEYLLRNDEVMSLIRSDRDIRKGLESIKTRLSA